MLRGNVDVQAFLKALSSYSYLVNTSQIGFVDRRLFRTFNELVNLCRVSEAKREESNKYNDGEEWRQKLCARCHIQMA